jgi:hypothetical protein
MYKGKDIQTNNSEEETRLDGLHPLADDNVEIFTHVYRFCTF